jgi:hypothetical protein
VETSSEVKENSIVVFVTLSFTSEDHVVFIM